MRKLKLAAALFATSSLTLLALPAMAQSAPPPATQASPPTPNTDQSGGVAQVVVRAERREESLQKVPLAVSVVGVNQLKATNFTGLTDLQYLTSSVQFNNYQGGGFEIRGIGTQSFNTSEEQEVAVVIDDVVQATPETNLSPPFYEALSDINHIEVLKGPQGTLFGKNSSAGVLQIITNRPQPGQFTDQIAASYGTHNEVKLNDIVNIPLGDKLTARVDAFDYNEDGIETNAYTRERIGNWKEYGVEGKLLWQPADRLDVYFIGDYRGASNDANGIWTLRNCGSGDGAFYPCQIVEAAGIAPGPKNLAVDDAGQIISKSNNWGGSMHVDYRLPDGPTLSSITAFYSLQELGSVNVDQTPTNYLSLDARPTHSQQFTQEFRISSPAGSQLEYTAGLYYYYVHVRDQDTLAGTLGLEPSDSQVLLGIPGPGASVIHVQSQSFAGYGQLTWHVTDQLRLIGGARFTYDTVKSAQQMTAQPDVCQIAYAFGAPCYPATYPVFPPYFPTGNTPFSLPTIPIGTTINATNLSGKVGVQYDFTPAIMGYATVSRGYKGPAVGYNPTEGFEVTPIAVKPETSWDYEAGLKTRLFDDRLVLNVDAFYTQYTNFQAQTYLYDQADPALSAFVLDNAGGLKTEGFEADAQYRPVHDLTFTGSFTYAPARFTKYSVPCTTGPAGAGPWVNQPIPGGPAACVAGPGGQLLFNAAGYPLSNAPDYSYMLAADYHHDFAGGYTFTANVNWNWRSSEYTVVADPNTIVPAYGLLGGSLGIGPTDGRWKLSVFGRNLLNQYFVSAIFPSFFDDGTDSGLAHPIRGYSNIPNPEAERTIGVRLDAKFGG